MSGGDGNGEVKQMPTEMVTEVVLSRNWQEPWFQIVKMYVQVRRVFLVCTAEKNSLIWRMFMTVTMESAVFMGKNYLNNCQSIVNTTDLTLKQMFDISTRLVSEQCEISGLETIGWEYHSWKYLSLIGDERVINLQRTKVYVLLDSVLCHG